MAKSIKSHPRAYIRKMPVDCQVRPIRFLVPQGDHARVVEFKGRHAGTTKFGGKCAPRRSTIGQKRAQRALAAAARACKGKHGHTFTSCVAGKASL